LNIEAKKINWLNLSSVAFTHVAALSGIYYWNVRAMVVCLVVYTLTGLGVTVGLHRLLAHRSFQTHPWLARTLAILGMLAMQRGPVEWVAIHRMHHSDTDGPGDPHNARRGFWYSHWNWLWHQDYSPRRIHRFSRDMLADPILVLASNVWFGVAMGVLLFFALWAAFDLPAAIWGTAVRLVLQYHFTFFVNSAAHCFGYRNYQTDDLSTNCWWVALMAFGEGWHNNHHHDPQSAAHGHKWWEIDPSWLFIKLLQRLGLAWNVKLADGVAAAPALMSDFSGARRSPPS
jgi:stearoyl-CoA desaturase (delta-9 desaturase)